MRNITKKIKRILLVWAVVCLTVVSIPADTGYAALKSAGTAQLVRSFVSTNHPTEELVKADVTGNYTMRIEYKSTIPATLYRLSLYKISGKDINVNLDFVPSTETDAEGKVWYSFVGKISTKKLGLKNGDFNLYIKRCCTEQEASDTDFSANGVAYKNMEVKITKYKIRIVTYPEVSDYNDSIIQKADAVNRDYYLDNTLEDIRFVLRNPLTNVYSTMYPYKISYIKQISDRICQGIESDYEKCKAIYEYTSGNFYYDNIALKEKALQYADPYDNIYNFENKLYASNAKGGIVYTTCQGYSAIYIALCRAQGIPTRMIYGHHLSVPKNNWYTETVITNYDHWWAESYVDGRWIFVDCTIGTTNQYNKNTGKVRDHGLTNYTFFDPSKEQIAQAHVYMNVYPDYNRLRFLTNIADIYKVKTFLESDSNGQTLRDDYNVSEMKTWGDGTESHAKTDGNGNLKLIKWENKGLKGRLDFSGIDTLMTLWLRNNEITDVNLNDDTKLSTVRLNGNPLKNVSIYINGRNRTFRALDHGTFELTYIKSNQKKLSICGNADIGYMVDGMYNTLTGICVSDDAYITFNPGGTDYEIRFAPDPDSYKYLLKPEGTNKNAGPYLQAAAKRLNELGYYDPIGIVPGEEDQYTDELAEACFRFRLVNGLKPTKNINRATWSVLFSEGAKSMVSSYEYDILLKKYEESLLPAEASATDASSTDIVSTETNIF